MAWNRIGIGTWFEMVVSCVRSCRSATDTKLGFAARAWNAGRPYRSCSEGYADPLSDALAGKQNQRQIKQNKHSE